MVRFVLHPLDCVKTTVQAEMGKEVEVGLDEGLALGELGAENVGSGQAADAGWIGTVQGIIKKGGWGELLRGIDVSTVRPCCYCHCLFHHWRPVFCLYLFFLLRVCCLPLLRVLLGCTFLGVHKQRWRDLWNRFSSLFFSLPSLSLTYGIFFGRYYDCCCFFPFRPPPPLNLRKLLLTCFLGVSLLVPFIFWI